MAYLALNVGLHASAQPTHNTFTVSKVPLPNAYNSLKWEM